jgi:uncharacterized protein YndB with AHSA1/START domain
MSSFTSEIKIDAPVGAVWEVLADYGNIYRWHPDAVASHLTTEKETGPGARRHLDLGGKNYLDEEVIEWESGQRLTVRIVATNLPFKSADIRITLRPENGGTVVTVAPLYELKFGLLGKLLDRLYVQRNYEKNMRALLAGLKDYVEGK